MHLAPELVLLVWEVIHPVLIRHILLLQGSLFSFFFFLNSVCTYICKDLTVHGTLAVPAHRLCQRRRRLTLYSPTQSVLWKMGVQSCSLSMWLWGWTYKSENSSDPTKAGRYVCSQDCLASSIVLFRITDSPSQMKGQRIEEDKQDGMSVLWTFGFGNLSDLPRTILLRTTLGWFCTASLV